ncbi:MAG TPA: Crp/Fnr family transcriptional regulator [Terriglobales bacterium]|nr:Crp/Fnr family transcriptional regulator [Terriglobales bacterium]
MKGPYGFELNEHCRTCKLRGNGFFCQLSDPVLKDFEQIRSASQYPAGAILFVEKQKCRGVYVLCEGEVKLSITSREGRTMIVKIVRAGEMLGLLAMVSCNAYEVTAETLRPSQVVFLHREEFLRFIAEHHEAHQNMVNQLSSQYRAVCEHLRTIGLTATVPEKLAKLLLDWSADSQTTNGATKMKLPLTHEEIGECIGVTRETVSRTLGEFKQRRLIRLQGATLMIPNRAALERFVNT